MKYSCSDCNYSTDDRRNWTRHIKSQKHLKNVEDVEDLKKEKDNAKLKNKKLPKNDPKMTQGVPENDPKMTRKLLESYPTITHASADSLSSDFDEDEKDTNKSNFNCPHCDKKFKFKSGLSRHINHRCPKINSLDEFKDNKLIEIIKQQNDLIKELKHDKEFIEELKHDKEYLKNDKEYLKNTTTDAICAVKYSSAALKFVAENYSNAPLLAPMPDYLAIKNDCGGRDLARVYCEFYRDGTLVRYLAQFFLDHYKKTKPEEQSFWNTDCSRLSYVICTIVDNQASWVTDKKGVELKKHIIKPLFDHIEKELYGFLKNPDNLKHTSLINSCTLLVQDIQSSVICDELLRYLAPHFQISNYKTPLAITERVVPTLT
jgi:hypothetical protein